MPDYTRRTHIVRVPMDGANPPSKTPSEYIDIEVLDAIAFRIDNGKEVIINTTASNSNPFIVDDTGGGHAKSPSAQAATQRTHMQRVASSDGKNKIDVEVLEIAAFRDTNGWEWILDMRDNQNVYDVTDHTGDQLSTRRVHDEKIYDGGPPKPGDTSGGGKFLTCQRNDAIAFRTINGKEVIFSLPSADDGTADRATTFVWSPQNYDPNDDNGPVPPPNKDAHVYVAPVAGADGFLTGAAKLAMGPLWWIRKVHTARTVLRIHGIAIKGADLDPGAIPANRSVFTLGLTNYESDVSGFIFGPNPEQPEGTFKKTIDFNFTQNGDGRTDDVDVSNDYFLDVTIFKQRNPNLKSIEMDFDMTGAAPAPSQVGTFSVTVLTKVKDIVEVSPGDVQITYTGDGAESDEFFDPLHHNVLIVDSDVDTTWVFHVSVDLTQDPLTPVVTGTKV